MRSEYDDFFDKIDLPGDFRAAAVPLCRRLEAEYPRELDALTEDPDPRSVYALCDKAGVERDLGMLAVGILLGIRAHGTYRAKGIDDEVYIASMRELRVWGLTCLRERGHIGFYEWGWFTNFLSAGIVRLGRLEFHEIPFHIPGREGDSYAHAGLCSKTGDRVVNIHIPEDGPLAPALVQDAFRRAYRYFMRSGPALFVCDSWLLWPGNYDFLPEDSNIRAFMDCFHILSRDDRRFAGDLWRVFGHRDSYDPASLPRDTGLRRAMADYLAAHDGVTGTGYGVFTFDGERIL